MDFKQVYEEMKKALRTVESAYDNADLGQENMEKLWKVVEASRAAFDVFQDEFDEQLNVEGN